jgi:hypothetical protein
LQTTKFKLPKEIVDSIVLKFPELDVKIFAMEKDTTAVVFPGSIWYDDVFRTSFEGKPGLLTISDSRDSSQESLDSLDIACNNLWQDLRLVERDLGITSENHEQVQKPAPDINEIPENAIRKFGTPGLSNEELAYRIKIGKQAYELRKKGIPWKDIAYMTKWRNGCDEKGIKCLQDAVDRYKRTIYQP